MLAQTSRPPGGGSVQEEGAVVESKPLSNLVSFAGPSLSPSVPQVVDVPPAEVAHPVAVGLWYMDPAVSGARRGKRCCRLVGLGLRRMERSAYSVPSFWGPFMTHSSRSQGFVKST